MKDYGGQCHNRYLSLLSLLSLLSQDIYSGFYTTIDENGVKFDKNKLQGALNIEQPTTVTQMQKLLGLTTHFRDHLPAGQRDRGIPDVTDLEKPLRQLITDARLKKTNKLTWNRTAETALPKLQRAIWNCQKLCHLQVYRCNELTPTCPLLLYHPCH